MSTGQTSPSKLATLASGSRGIRFMIRGRDSKFSGLNAYGWVGRNDPPIGYPTQIFLWVTPLHPRGPAQLHLIIDTSAGGQNLP
jgi:hypothetical protein